MKSTAAASYVPPGSRARRTRTLKVVVVVSTVAAGRSPAAHVGALDVAALVSSRRHCRRMADNKESLRALKIKTGIMTRVKKELAMYRQEVETEGAKLEKMKAEGRDPFDIKQQDQVLGESSMMIGDCKTRMENAFNDLLAAVVRARHREPARPNSNSPSSPRVPTRGGPRSDTHRPFPSPGRTRRRVRRQRGARRGQGDSRRGGAPHRGQLIRREWKSDEKRATG